MRHRIIDKDHGAGILRRYWLCTANAISSMPDDLQPRLSQAKYMLPLLRERIVNMSMAYPLPKGLSIGLVPIVEEGLFGFELETDRDTRTYLIIGCNAQGAPVLREAMYDTRAPGALQLVARHGQRLAQPEREGTFRAQRRDSQFNDWPDAVAGYVEPSGDAVSRTSTATCCLSRRKEPIP